VLTILPRAFVSVCRGAKCNLVEDIHLSDSVSEGNVPLFLVIFFLAAEENWISSKE
jgi:hypothetical protein